LEKAKGTMFNVLADPSNVRAYASVASVCRLWHVL